MASLVSMWYQYQVFFCIQSVEIAWLASGVPFIDVQNAFVLEGPKRQWICATEKEEEKLTWLSALKSAISAAIKDN